MPVFDATGSLSSGNPARENGPAPVPTSVTDRSAPRSQPSVALLAGTRPAGFGSSRRTSSPSGVMTALPMCGVTSVPPLATAA